MIRKIGRDENGKTLYAEAAKTKGIKGTMVYSHSKVSNNRFIMPHEKCDRIRKLVPDSLFRKHIKPISQQRWEGDMRKALLHNKSLPFGII
jgi:hypothetical protein